ncbi:uncharacterized protein LOC128856713 [Anastrepha ludens]|uniref:uncharacterized protein LOC128856713 n=1 Tax=Anastrepha ludens TaxID=28586 RepID=UPI0023B1392D|nr:uncharacterized protein LOC128856713 [Anastrepha ludens]
MQPLENIFFSAILILCCASLINSRPLPFEGAAPIGRKHENGAENRQKTQRQVVQPKWLTNVNGPELFTDGIVRITPQKLKETAALRDAIQKAVKEGHFAVDIYQDQQVQLAPFNRGSDQQNVQPVPQQSSAPQFVPIPLALFNPTQWTFQLPTMPAGLPMNQEQPNLLQRMWNDFLVNNHRMLEQM